MMREQKNLHCPSTQGPLSDGSRWQNGIAFGPTPGPGRPAETAEALRWPKADEYPVAAADSAAAYKNPEKF